MVSRASFYLDRMTSEPVLFKTVWPFSIHFLMMQNIKMKYAFGCSFLTQIVPAEKSGIVGYKNSLFIKVFTRIADR
jgi:hypothetical protein